MQLERNLSYEEELVLNLLPKKKPVCKDDIVDRKYIKQITGFNYRDISYIIEELRKYYPICSSRGLRGYWLGSKEEALKFAVLGDLDKNGLWWRALQWKGAWYLRDWKEPDKADAQKGI